MSVEHLCLYEDEGFEKLLPLVYFRPVFELLCGAATLSERVRVTFPEAELHLLVRDYLVESTRDSVPATSCNDLRAIEGSALFLSGRLLDVERGDLPLEGDDEVFLCRGQVVGFRLTGESLRAWRDRLAAPVSKAVLEEIRGTFPAREAFASLGPGEALLATYPWDLIEANPCLIARDAQLLERPGLASAPPGVVVLGEEGETGTAFSAGGARLEIAGSARVDPSVVIDLTDGPVLIGEWTVIRPPTIISGPCFIGDSVVVDGAKIRPGTSIGDCCRVAGEVEQSIFLPHVNKHHEGFIGHAYVCSWTNLGALTTNSDLKNNYRSVRVMVGGEEVESGLLKVGCFIGDHTKTGIGTLIDTGAVIGPFCNILGGRGPTPKFVPAFSWDSPDGFVEHRLDQAIENARTVCARRDRTLGAADERLIEQVYSLTAADREPKG